MSICVSRLKSILVQGAALSALLTASAQAAPLSFLRPNIATTAGASSVVIGGQTFVNQGLQGVARLSATTTKDFNGDTFGAFSSLDIYPGSWRKTATGYSGTLYALPDRGPNGIGSVSFSDYAGRTSSFAMNFTPYTSSTNLPVSAASQQQLQLTQNGGFFFKDFNGSVTTGFDPGAPGVNSFVTQNGMNLPGSKIGSAAGKIALDAEGLRFLKDGSFYVSDEYGANVYYFNKAGQMQGVVQPPAALTPRDAAGNLSYTSLTDATTGRRLNQGLEGMDVTPDSKKLVTLLQSAAMQDSTSAQQTRTNTRLMLYDITGTKSPTTPIGDYVVQLPIYRSNGDGGAADRTAAQSEILALNDTQFLVLARDANGLGLANLPTVFKSVVLVDISNATNIAGTNFETTNTPISPAGVLNSSITPVAQTEVVNILNSTQLGKFGINLNNAAPTALTLTEKWEGMALVPVLEESAPQDYFLLIGNDNDFLSSNCSVGGQNCAQAVNSDGVVLVYRVTLPTYVDSEYLDAMTSTGPLMQTLITQAARDLAVSPDIAQHLQVLRHDNAIRPAQAGSGLSVWLGGGWASRGESTMTTEARTTSLTLGLDAQIDPNLLLGAAVGVAYGDSDVTGGFGANHNAVQLSGYGSYRWDGFYADLTGTYSRVRLTSIARPGAYGLTATGATKGEGYGITGEAGYLLELDETFQAVPLAGFRAIGTSLDGYAESGASGGNILFPNIARSSVNGFVGGEVSGVWDDMRAILRLTYNSDDSYDAKNASLKLINANHAMGTQSVLVPGLGQASIAPSLTLTGGSSWTWHVGYGATIGVKDGLENHVSGGMKFNF